MRLPRADAPTVPASADGHVYERSAITEWFACSPRAKPPTSPLTGLPLAHTRLKRATRLAAAIAAWKAERREGDDSDSQSDCQSDDCAEGCTPRGSRRCRQNGASGRRSAGGALAALRRAADAEDASAVVAVLRAAAFNASVTAVACRTLAAIVCRGGGAQRAAACAAGGAEAAVGALKAHPSEAAVAAAASHAIRMLTAGAGGGAAGRVAAAGGAEALVRSRYGYCGSLVLVLTSARDPFCNPSGSRARALPI
jgi:hypothetical protein